MGFGHAITPLLIVFAEDSPWWDYPGLESWKFANLIIFLGLAIYVLKRPLSDALRTRRETIRRELQLAKQAMDQATAKLTQIESRLSTLGAEVVRIQEQATAEAEAERERIVLKIQSEIATLRSMAQRQIESAGKVATQELRQFVAQESVKTAEEKIRRSIRTDDDARIVRASLARLGGNQN